MQVKKVTFILHLETLEMNEPINPIPMAPCKEKVNTSPLSLEKLNHHDLP